MKIEILWHDNQNEVNAWNFSTFTTRFSNHEIKGMSADSALTLISSNAYYVKAHSKITNPSQVISPCNKMFHFYWIQISNTSYLVLIQSKKLPSQIVLTCIYVHINKVMMNHLHPSLSLLTLNRKWIYSASGVVFHVR